MPFVQRDGSGAIVGLFGSRQPGFADEFLADDAAEVVAYQAGQPGRLWAMARDLAKGLLADTHDPGAVLIRNGFRVLFAGLVETRQAFNALLARLQNPANPLPTVLPIRTWPQFVAAVKQQTDTEVDPNT